MPDGTLVFDTKIDKAGFERGMTQLEQSTNTIGSTFKGVLGGTLASNVISSATSTLVDLSTVAVTTASDLAEVQNVVDTTFGEGADQVNAFAESAMQAYGLTELQAKKYTSTLGAMLKSMGLTDEEVLAMSEDMAALAGDMASFYNLDHDTAFDKIRSGLSGETEPLKQLGINLSAANLESFALAQGLEKAYDEMTEAEKAGLRYSYIMNATADAQGDFVRTSEGFANQARILQGNLSGIAATVGGALLPVLETGLRKINALFAGPAENKLLTDINNATDELDGMNSRLTGIKNDFVQESIKINVSYQKSQDLLDDLAAIETAYEETGEYEEKMREITAGLVGTYSELSQYVGEDGILTLESSQVRALIEDYRQLALEKAMSKASEEMTAEYANAVLQLEILRQKEKEAQAEYDALIAKQNELQQAYSGMETATEQFYQQMQIKGAADPTGIAAALDQYIAAFGGLSDQITEYAQGQGIDLTQFFGLDGSVSAEKIAASEESLSEFLALLDGISAYGAPDNNAFAQGISAAGEAVEAAQEAVAEYEPTLTQLESDIETMQSAFSTLMDEIKNGAAETGAEAGEAGATAMEESADSYESAGKAALDAYQRGLNAYTPTIKKARTFAPAAYVDGSHASGLDRVPYDGYIARLHAGEAVLNAREAEKWRGGKSGIDYGAMAAAIAAAFPDGGGAPVVRLYIDGKELASSQASNNKTAIATRSATEARGYGKR